ncbi:transposase [Nocardioides aromaticivorans]|uniref:transposase n=1 Tax=Nocardioides aromaticivorans TaxID=200618 RepID=UPI00358DAFAA
MAVDLRRDPATRSGALRRVGDQLGINAETLRNWVSQAEIDAGERGGTTTAETRRITELEREVKELRRANDILKTAAFRRGGARPQDQVTTAVLDPPCNQPLSAHRVRDRLLRHSPARVTQVVD